MNRNQHKIPDIALEALVQKAIEEDVGQYGDVTTSAVVPENLEWTAFLRPRKDGVLSGLQTTRLLFGRVDPSVIVDFSLDDGDTVKAGETIATLKGSARSILTAERTVLNFLSHLSGIATMTRRFVEETIGTRARITCTRKTTPGLRIVEKQAVLHGGGFNHRFSLSDAILIKDNHIEAAGGIHAAIERARSSVSHMMRIEIEVDTLAQLSDVLDAGGADCVLLDNMSLSNLKRAVDMIDGQLVSEASGTIQRADVRGVAGTGVDYISSGAITHSAPILDIGLDFA